MTKLPEVASSSAPVRAQDRLIVALDVPTARQARELAAQLGDAAGIYKVGLQLFTAEGPAVVRDLVSSGKRVFLDLKLHDIPNTVAHAVKSASALGASMLTVHASGGPAMLQAAVEAAERDLIVLAVTVLTSMDENELSQVGTPDRVQDQVIRLAKLSRTAGCRGVVASARESSLIRSAVGEGFAIVNPGVRPAGAELNDQRRVATPAEAIRAGATHIVVGRPITQAADPEQAAAAIVMEIEQAQAGR
jgi:orotidine-5'-phosphate decarboxylase